MFAKPDPKKLAWIAEQERRQRFEAEVEYAHTVEHVTPQDEYARAQYDARLAEAQGFGSLDEMLVSDTALIALGG